MIRIGNLHTKQRMMRATYGGGFLPIPTDSYSDVTFSYEDKRHGYQVSH